MEGSLRVEGISFAALLGRYNQKQRRESETRHEYAVAITAFSSSPASVAAGYADGRTTNYSPAQLYRCSVVRDASLL